MTARVSKVYRAAEVCELAQLQSYVLRSWEKEFPGIGVQKALDSPRLYRQSDLDQVLRIKQLVFGEGLTLSGARRRLEQMPSAREAVSESDVAEVIDALASDARTRIAYVKDGLRSILRVLSRAPGMVFVVDDFQLEPPVERGRAKVSSVKAGNSKAGAASLAVRSAPRAVVALARSGQAKKATGKVVSKPKRSRASA
jgi:DNA-binding transcriptional MerR regulator